MIDKSNEKHILQNTEAEDSTSTSTVKVLV